MGIWTEEIMERWTALLGRNECAVFVDQGGGLEQSQEGIAIISSHVEYLAPGASIRRGYEH